MKTISSLQNMIRSHWIATGPMVPLDPKLISVFRSTLHLKMLISIIKGLFLKFCKVIVKCLVVFQTVISVRVTLIIICRAV